MKSSLADLISIVAATFYYFLVAPWHLYVICLESETASTKYVQLHTW
jgi:hypothetical protein